jgi:hypothetical protein
LPSTIAIDGRLTEAAWESADVIDDFRQTDPVEGALPTARTRMQVLADTRSIVIGIVCEEPDPATIVSFSVRRDAVLTSEDHVRIVLGPFADGRSGYVFAVNPTGARYDGIINPGGESDNPDWDGIWEAATARLPTGWSAEIRIPVLTLAFKPGLHEWQFNVQRRIQRRLEIDRWASPNRQYQITQTSQAGLLTDLPDFDLGVGLTVRPAVTGGGGIPSFDADMERDFQPSLDISQRVGANVLASGTVNTDFAETEVDTRRTNLTRFPLFFPEKRTSDRSHRRSRGADSGGGQGERPRRRHELRRRGRRHKATGERHRRAHVHGRQSCEAESVESIMDRRNRHGRRSARPCRQLAGRRRFHLCHVTFPERQEFPRRRVGACDRTRGSR